MADSQRTCTLNGCERKLRARGLCGAHYMAAKRSRTLPSEWTRQTRTTPPMAEHFWSFVLRGADGACWEWQGATSRGYGHIRIDGRPQRAHRIAYRLEVGEIPDGMHIDHVCRNRRCVNPDHLRPVTHAENQQDRNVRRDSSSGIRNVFWHARDKRWEVFVRLNGKAHFGGSYARKEDAKEAAVALRQKLFSHSPD